VRFTRARRWSLPAGAGAVALVVGAGWVFLRHAGVVVVGAGGELARGRGALQGIALAIARRPAGIPIAIGLFAAAGVLFVPLTALAAVTLAAFGTWPGIGIAWAGGALAAALSHLAGGRLGQAAVARLSARFGRNPGALLRRHGFWSGVVCRLLPGNFGAANLLAGALTIPRWAFLTGNAVGLLIELVGLGVVLDRALAASAAPTRGNVLSAVLLIGGVLGAGVAIGRGVRRWLQSRSGPIPQ
jgi:uncharacterized membrane protein YdjX (TVP38/TMEM64 family)